MRADAEPQRFDYPTREALTEALAQRVAGALEQALAERGHALLAVSGGTTPALFFQHLSHAAIAWPQVTVTLVDERFVAEDSSRSNARLAKTNLLTERAASANFLPLYTPTATVEAAAAAANAAIGSLPLPFDVVVLGMGTDGHTASFFPDAATLPQLLDPQAPVLVAAVHAESGVEPRITMTLKPIIASRLVALHIEGEAKRNVLASALAGADVPIGAVLNHSTRPVEVYWAP
jgi:6-phosphogluconolactonase